MSWYKVWTVNRQIKKCVKADALDELKESLHRISHACFISWLHAVIPYQLCNVNYSFVCSSYVIIARCSIVSFLYCGAMQPTFCIFVTQSLLYAHVIHFICSVADQQVVWANRKTFHQSRDNFSPKQVSKGLLYCCLYCCVQ